jgi:ABC-type polysaccharide/polyol phosphate export permease
MGGKMKHRLEFLLELVKRKILEKYIGNYFLFLWVFLNPLFVILVNLFIFYYIAKLPQALEMGVLGYTVFVFSGLLPFGLVQKSLIEASTLLLSNMHILKNCYFPVENLNIVSIVSVLFDFLIQFAFLVLLVLLSGKGIGLSILLFPLFVLLIVMACLGIGWLITLIGFLVKEVSELLGSFLSLLVYFTPIMYPNEVYPDAIRWVIFINPISHVVICFRDLFFFRDSLHLESWFFLSLFSILSFMLGFITIRKSQKYMGDLV